MKKSLLIISVLWLVSCLESTLIENKSLEKAVNATCSSEILEKCVFDNEGRHIEDLKSEIALRYNKKTYSFTCSNLSEDEGNCGQCGKKCVGLCTNGQCMSVLCKKNEILNDNGQCYCPGFNDNRPDAVYNTNDHCGSCGNKCGEGSVCQYNNGQYRCTCENSSLVSCFGSACKFDLQSDPQNCGECGLDCSAFDNVESGKCSRGSCIFTCKNGFGNCDKDGKNGCETALDQINTCNSCTSDCTRFFLNIDIGKSSCYQSTDGSYKCRYILQRCKVGYENCDKDPSNGCEVYVGLKGCP